MTVPPDLQPLLSDEGWPYASTPPVDEDDPGRFHALFGRDSLITSLQVLPAAPEVAVATLRGLAARQGARTDAGTQEEPGKIGHEFRDAPPESFVAAGWPPGGTFSYFGTADATSWFCVVLATVGDEALLRELEPARRGAAAWLTATLDRGDGLLRHSPGGFPGGLTQQGWRDTIDAADPNPEAGGFLREDGSAPEPPLADADTQAVTYAALRALGRISPAGEDDYDARADALRARLSRQYVPDVVALERGDRAVHGAGSQLGWLLWADALEPDLRDAAAARLSEPDILTDFGLRTLSSDAAQFNPVAYHRGSIWPFDSWLGWGGLRAAGHAEAAERVRTGVLDAIERLGRAPELYAVDRGGELQRIPIANRVQAWTIGARWALANEWDGLSPSPPRGS
jgi:glycogen debranching enzyme